MNRLIRNTIDDRILQRVYGEFLEMPGLRLTFRQAQRLWGLDEGTCRRVLDVLVEARFLHCPARDTFARLSAGGDTPGRLHMAKAALTGAEGQHMRKIV